MFRGLWPPFLLSLSEFLLPALRLRLDCDARNDFLLSTSGGFGRSESMKALCLLKDSLPEFVRFYIVCSSFVIGLPSFVSLNEFMSLSVPKLSESFFCEGDFCGNLSVFFC